MRSKVYASCLALALGALSVSGGCQRAGQGGSGGKRIGVTLLTREHEFYRQLEAGLKEAAAEAGTEIEIVEEVSPEAYTALLADDAETHDRLLLDAVERLEKQGVSAVVLAQVSMARVLPLVGQRVRVPVLTSLHTSLDAIREALAETSRD